MGICQSSSSVAPADGPTAGVNYLEMICCPYNGQPPSSHEWDGQDSFTNTREGIMSDALSLVGIKNDIQITKCNTLMIEACRALGAPAGENGESGLHFGMHLGEERRSKLFERLKKLKVVRDLYELECVQSSLEPKNGEGAPTPEEKWKEWEAQLAEFLRIADERAHIIIEKMKKDKHTPEENWKEDNHGCVLSKENLGIWFSRRQYAFGQIVADMIRRYKVSKLLLHPIWIMLLFPTGGIAGSGNDSIFVGDMHDAIVVHAVVHDACGYMWNYHNQLGPGYNYLNTRWTTSPKSSPLSCQVMGVRAARRMLKKKKMYGDKGKRLRHKMMEDRVKNRKEGAFHKLKMARGITGDFKGARPSKTGGGAIAGNNEEKGPKNEEAPTLEKLEKVVEERSGDQPPPRLTNEKGEGENMYLSS